LYRLGWIASPARNLPFYPPASINYFSPPENISWLDHFLSFQTPFVLQKKIHLSDSSTLSYNVINPPFPALVMLCKTRHFLPLCLPLPIKENAIAGILGSHFLCKTMQSCPFPLSWQIVWHSVTYSNQLWQKRKNKGKRNGITKHLK